LGVLAVGKMAESLEVECPNHQGSLDCSPFCPLCEGNQFFTPKEREDMDTYLVTITERYTVKANTPEQAIASYRHEFDDIEPEIFGMTLADMLEPDSFTFLDGSITAEEGNE
jgi:hypothetical protein